VPIAILFMLWASVAQSHCFPDCWMTANAVTYFVPMLVAVNVLLVTGKPDTAPRRASAFVASAFFAGLFFTQGWTGLVPLALVGMVRAPDTRRAMSWAIGMSIPAAVMGWLVAQT
jgi:hypothetical protein